MTGRKESVVQAGVLAYLYLRKDCICWRSNTGGVKFGNAYVKFGLRGAADIQCVQAPTGRFIGIECKREIGGRLSKDQETWGQNVEIHGGLYVVARDVAAVERALGPEQVRVTKIVERRRSYPR
jgi:hypothetical protein